MQGINLAQGLFFGLFLAGLAGGFSHCAMMCGPFVLSLTNDVEKTKGALLIPYHLGRISTYTVLAILLAAILNLAFLFLPIRSFIIAPILMTAALLFLINAFPNLKKYFPWLDVFNIRVPFAWISSAFQKLSQHKNLLSQYLIGVMLGFMPCGLTVSALMAAAVAPSALEAALGMMAFGLGTMPALILTGLFGQGLKTKFPTTMQHVTRGAMVWSALWLFLIAGMNLM